MRTEKFTSWTPVNLLKPSPLLSLQGFVIKLTGHY